MVAGARTLLFVPGHRSDQFAKAANSAADGMILDLEDAVGPDSKAGARLAVLDWLDAGGGGVVRINAPGTPWHHDDVQALQGQPRLVMVPKATPASVGAVIERLPVGSCVVALIESAAGVLHSRETAAVPGVVRLALGNIDLGAELGVNPEDHLALLTTRSTLVLASAAAGIASPLDGVTADFHDADALTDDVAHALSLGFTGKLCIHPRQLETVHRALTPSPAEVLQARRVIAAAGTGDVTVLDGKMLDKPVVARAHGVLRRLPPRTGP